MKIIQVMPDFGLAGAEIMCENLMYQLKNMGNEVLAVSLYDFHSPITERLEAEKIPVIYLNKKPGLDPAVIWNLTKLFRKEKPDVIHTHLYVMKYAIPAAILAGIKKRIHTLHSVAQKESEKPARVLARYFYKYGHVKPVALSELVKDSVIEEYGITGNQIPVILNGINLLKCKPKESYEVSNQFKILHIGRFTEAKNHKLLLTAFKAFHEKHRDSELQLLGDGECHNQVVELIADLDLNDCVTLLGLQSDVSSFLHSADIFTLPSKWEGIPMTLIEAMGTGLPIVATCVGGIPDMIKNEESGLLCGQSSDELANAFERCYLNQELREKLGRNALMESPKFSSEKMARAYMAIYKG